VCLGSGVCEDRGLTSSTSKSLSLLPAVTTWFYAFLTMTDTFLLIFIIGCETSFWIVLLTGFLVRYLLGLRTLSTILLVCVPVIDVALLIATTIDLSRGTTATFVHGLAAAYIGFSIAFGGVSISWADNWFAHKFADGEPPVKAPDHGWKLVRSEFIWWLRCILAVAVTQSLVFLAIIYIDDPIRSEALNLWFTLPLVTVALWFIFGPLWVLLFNRSPPEVNDT
jgi:hypothetical protein